MSGRGYHRKLGHVDVPVSRLSMQLRDLEILPMAQVIKGIKARKERKATREIRETRGTRALRAIKEIPEPRDQADREGHLVVAVSQLHRAEYFIICYVLIHE